MRARRLVELGCVVSYDDRFSETKMDVYLPDGGGLHPGVMFVHGGGWAHGSRSAYAQAAKRLASSGWVTARACASQNRSRWACGS